MAKFDNYGGAPYEEPDYEDSREIVAEFREQNGKLYFVRYRSLITLNEEHFYTASVLGPNPINDLLTESERGYFCEDHEVVLADCIEMAEKGEHQIEQEDHRVWLITKAFPITVYKTRKTMTVNEFVGYEVDSFGSWGRSVYKYTDCGPWVVALLPDGRELYYEDREAWEYAGDQPIVGVRLGSIVEGWDGELPPYDCYTREEFDKALEELEETTSYIWELANGDFFIINRGDENIGGAQNVWGDVKLEVTGLNSREMRRLRRFIEKAHWADVRRFHPGWKGRPGHWYKSSPSAGDTWKLGRTGIEVIYYEPEIMW